MASGIDAKRNYFFQLKLSQEERAALEEYVEALNAELTIGRVTSTDVLRAALTEYIERHPADAEKLAVAS